MRFSMQQQLTKKTKQKRAQVCTFDIVTLISNGYTIWKQNNSLATIFKSFGIAHTIIDEVIQLNPPNLTIEELMKSIPKSASV
jgi:hypothetical protein